MAAVSVLSWLQEIILQVSSLVLTFKIVYIQVDGAAHVVHHEEESVGTRLMIDSLTCLLANETDPSRLLASSPGKLMKCIIADGEHIAADQSYAEIEVSWSGICAN